MTELSDGKPLTPEQAETRQTELLKAFLEFMQLPRFEERLAAHVKAQLALPSSQPDPASLGVDRLVMEALRGELAREAIANGVRSHLMSRYVVVAALAALGGLAYFGIQLTSAKELADKARIAATAAEQKAVEAELRASNALSSSKTAASAAELAKSSAESYAKYTIDTSASALDRALNTVQKVNEFDRQASDAKIQAAQALSAAEAASRATSGAMQDVRQLRERAEFQTRLMNVAALDMLYLTDGQAAQIELSRRGGRHYAVKFTVKRITSPNRTRDKAFGDVQVNVDKLHELQLERLPANRGDALPDWQDLPGTDGNYKFKIDQIFYIQGDEGVDFAVIRVRASDELLKWLNQGAPKPPAVRE